MKALRKGAQKNIRSTSVKGGLVQYCSVNQVPGRKLPRDYNDLDTEKTLIVHNDDLSCKEVSPITPLESTDLKQITCSEDFGSKLDDSASDPFHTLSLLECKPQISIVPDLDSENILLVCQNKFENWENQDIESGSKNSYFWARVIL